MNRLPPITKVVEWQERHLERTNSAPNHFLPINSRKIRSHHTSLKLNGCWIPRIGWLKTDIAEVIRFWISFDVILEDCEETFDGILKDCEETFEGRDDAFFFDQSVPLLFNRCLQMGQSEVVRWRVLFLQSGVKQKEFRPARTDMV